MDLFNRPRVFFFQAKGEDLAAFDKCNVKCPLNPGNHSKHFLSVGNADKTEHAYNCMSPLRVVLSIEEKNTTLVITF